MYYDKPLVYTISHYIIGFISVWFPILGIIMIIYQITQFIFNKRFFILKMEFKKGNSLQHTLLKLFEFSIGYGIGFLFVNFYLSKS